MALWQIFGETKHNLEVPEKNIPNKVFAHNVSEGEEPQRQTAIWPRPLAQKWTVTLFLGTCLLYCARMAMPICAVNMATTFGWSKTQSGVVMGGFFWGYCFTQVLGGHVSDRIGGERVLLLATTSWASITACTPLLAQLGISSLTSMTVARFLMGLLQGVHYPSLASLCSQRVDEGERGFLMSTMGSGSYMGTLMVGGLGSLMLERYGWESVFYGAGLLSGLWSLTVWRFLLRGQMNTIQVLSSHGSSSGLSKKRWLKMFKQPSVCAMVFAHLCFSSTCYSLMSWLPTFFKDTYPHAKGWVCNVIPWLVAIASALFGGIISDHLIQQGFRTSSVRKMMQFMSMGVSSVFLLLLCRPLSFPSAVIFVSAAMGLATFNSSGVSVNVQDLAPSCAGALFGFMNMCGAFTGLVLVYVSGYLIEVTASWGYVFSLFTMVNTMGLGVFLMFGEANRVDLWNLSEVTRV
ncbi:solute carrier family 17 member 9-like [Oncorhynchus tshawytscha]|uniref:Voltage-gated purine nucleotide uniporter SLC17A9 n=1 Tax=Oncorhynchus tshawytscha TaxID=74940 RepID=A0A8C8CVX2_ONCTS|nr:solute carrier family 17 member 9-like [Oncorhynchus tshawytscha]